MHCVNHLKSLSILGVTNWCSNKVSLKNSGTCPDIKYEACLADWKLFILLTNLCLSCFSLNVIKWVDKLWAEEFGPLRFFRLNILIPQGFHKVSCWYLTFGAYLKDAWWLYIGRVLVGCGIGLLSYVVIFVIWYNRSSNDFQSLANYEWTVPFA